MERGHGVGREEGLGHLSIVVGRKAKYVGAGVARCVGVCR